MSLGIGARCCSGEVYEPLFCTWCTMEVSIRMQVHMHMQAYIHLSVYILILRVPEKDM